MPGTSGDVPRVGIGVLGASGYTGGELVRLLASHPRAALHAAGSQRYAGIPVARVWPSLASVDLVLEDDPLDPSAWVDRGVETVFAALPHGVFAARASAYLDAGLKVIDLSADFRLRDPEAYRRRYHVEHPAAHLLGRSIYGLSEWCGSELADASLVANPGCYATAILLAALPVVKAGWWREGPIIANALSGVSGAGRAPELKTHFVECGNGAAPYKVGESHPHLGEIEQALARLGSGGGKVGPVVFNPHLVPMARGIVANIAIPLVKSVSITAAQELYSAHYGSTPFVRLLDGEELPETRHVRGSNRCDLALRVAAGGRLLLVFAAIDNLVKGAAGQAIQNWNRVQGWPEETGLPFMGWACA
jgi:N-acetyl-gamma-glutamyl-phosphate reductase